MGFGTEANNINFKSTNGIETERVDLMFGDNEKHLTGMTCRCMNREKQTLISTMYIVYEVVQVVEETLFREQLCA